MNLKSKQEILSELLLYIAHRFQQGMKNINESSYSPFEKIKVLIALQIRLTTENMHAIGLLTQDWKQLKEPYLAEFLSIRKSYSDNFMAIVEASMEQGEIKKANPEITLNSILSSLRWLYDWYSEDKKVSPIELEIQITGLLVHGIRV